MGVPEVADHSKSVVFTVARLGRARYIVPRNTVADVAELADAQPSGGCDRKVVEVQLLSSAPP